jgi:Coenzyme PQQ synthesis protein D (PqqD)
VRQEPRPHPDVVWRRLDDEVVIVHLKSNQIYRLNRTAARFWELIAEGADRANAERVLTEEFEVMTDELRQETSRLLDELSNDGLLA